MEDQHTDSTEGNIKESFDRSVLLDADILHGGRVQDESLADDDAR